MREHVRTDDKATIPVDFARRKTYDRSIAHYSDIVIVNAKGVLPNALRSRRCSCC